MTNNFHGIVAWQKAHEFVLMVYRETKNFPDFEKFGLCSQFQRAAVSIPANIAEGYKKMSKADKLRFYNIAQGSLEECRYYVLLSKASYMRTYDTDIVLVPTNESVKDEPGELEISSEQLKEWINKNTYRTEN